MNNTTKSPAKPAIPFLESPVSSSGVSSSPPAGGLPLLPANASMWDGPLRLDGEVKDEEKEDEDDGDENETHPRTPQKQSGSPQREWSPLPSPMASSSPYQQASQDRQLPPPLVPLNQVPVGMRLQEDAKGTLQFHGRFMDHLIEALNQSSLAHDAMCIQVHNSITAIEEQALGRLNPDALRYMMGALQVPRQVRSQPQRNRSSWKRRSSKSPTKTERKARAKAARQRSSYSGCGPDCGHPKGPSKRDDEDDPPSYAPSFPVK